MMLNDLDRIELGQGFHVNLVTTRNKRSNITKAKLPEKLEEFFEKKKHYDHNTSTYMVKEFMDFIDENPVYTESSYLKKYEKD